jgi:hypothetical protein
MMEATKREIMQPDGEPGGPVDSKPWDGKVSMKGPKKPSDPQGEELPGVPGWSRADIDFKKDGTIFIRNPYLADALENFLMANWDAIANGDKKRHFLRIARDEGWSGNVVNIVC